MFLDATYILGGIFMTKCPNCGFSNDDNCTFCAICGSSVTQDNFYVNNNTNTDFSVEELTEKLISKNKEENAKTKSFKKLDKATIAKEAAKIEFKDEAVKEYKSTSKNNTDKGKELSTDNKTNNEIKSENTVVKKEDKDITQNPVNENSDTKVKQAKETINNKEDQNTKTETKPKENEKAESKTNNEENKNIKPAINSEETPDSEKGSTDGELYRLLSKFFFDTKNENSLLKQDDIDENCNLAMVSYIPFLFFIPMIIKPCSGYLRYHGIQGLTMFLTFIILEFFNIILGAICNSVFNDMLGTVLTVIITVVINLAVLLLISIGIANAVKGAARELPIIGKYKLLKPYIY